MINVEMISDWEDFDEVYINNDVITGIWYHNQFIDLNECMRFHTPWCGKAPEAETAEGEKISLAGFYADNYDGCYIEIDRAGEQYRLWNEVFK